MANIYPAAPRSDFNRRWTERVSNSFMPTTAFSYEIIFQHQHTLGLNLKPYSLGYSLGAPNSCLSCCMVIDTSNPILATIVQPGDLLIKVNTTNLVGTPSEPFSFDDAMSAIVTASTPRTIRFMRFAGASPNMYPSPVEVLVYLGAENPSARFAVSSSSSHPSLVYLESHAPMMVKKLMQGQKIMWETLPLPPNVAKGTGAAVSGSHTNSTLAKVVNVIGQKRSAAPFADGDVIVPDAAPIDLHLLEGVFRDKVKWIVIVHVPTSREPRSCNDMTEALSSRSDSGLSELIRGMDQRKASSVELGGRELKKRRVGSSWKSYHLGRFETEDEARTAYKMAKEEIAATGGFNCYAPRPPKPPTMSSKSVPAAQSNLATVVPQGTAAKN